MAGIAGWVDLTGPVAARPQVVVDMMVALAHRGSARREVWQDHLAALGLCAREPGAPAMPAVARTDGNEPVVLCYDGWLDNADELRRDLTAQSRPGHGLSDPDCLLQAYLAWGPRAFERVHGAYAVAVWDAHRQELLLVRDRLAVKPLYYVPTPHGVLFGSEPAAIFAHPEYRPAVDLEGFRELIAPSRAPAASVWRGMAEVPGGSVVTVGRDGCRVAGYWRLEAEAIPDDDLPARAAALRETLSGIVGRHLGTAEAPGCLLSGGLDSSVVGVLAARQLGERGPLRTYTLDFAGYAENFRPDKARPTPDAPFAREVAEFVAAQHVNVELSVAQLTDPEVRHVVWTAADRLPSQCDLTRGLLLLYRAAAAGGSRTVLSGEGADELFGMGPISDADAAQPGPTFPWLAWTSGFPRFTVLRPQLHRRLDMEAHIAGLYKEALSECPQHGDDTAHDRRMRESIFLYTLHDMSRTVERADRLGAATGIEVRFPFLDHRVIELTFNSGYQMHTCDGREKSLLRAAAQGLVPESIIQRRKSNLPTPQDAAYDVTIGREYVEMTEDPKAAIHEIAHAPTLAWLAKDLGGQMSALYLRRMREDALALNSWLTRFGGLLHLE